MSEHLAIDTRTGKVKGTSSNTGTAGKPIDFNDVFVVGLGGGGAAANAFGTIVVGATSVVADAAPDTLTLVAGSNITLTPNAATDTITIASSGGGGGGSSMSSSITQTAHGFNVGNVLKYTGAAYAKALADTATNAEVVGLVSAVADANNFTLTIGGVVAGLSGLTAGNVYFLSTSTAGLLTTTAPSVIDQISKPLLVASSTTGGYFFNWRGWTVAGPGSGGGGGGGNVSNVATPLDNQIAVWTDATHIEGTSLLTFVGGLNFTIPAVGSRSTLTINNSDTTSKSCAVLFQGNSVNQWHIANDISVNGGLNFFIRDLITSGSPYKLYIDAGGVHLPSVDYFGWSSASGGGSLIDTAFMRNSAGIVEINNGTLGTYRDLKLRTLTLAGGTTIAVSAPATATGAFLKDDGTWAAPGGAGGGTVTTFSAGDLAPLFTTTEANPTTAPALSFALTNAAATSVFGRAAGTSGAPTYSTSPQFLAIGNLTSNGFVKTGGGVGTLSVDTATYLTANQNISLTGDVTGGPAATSIATTIANSVVTYGKIQNVSATSRFLGRITAAAGVVEELTAANAKTILALTSTDVGLGSVTNAAQTLASVVPNTLPSAGQILIGNAGNTAYAKNTLSGSGATMSLGATGVLTISAIPETSLSITNVTTGDATTSAHGFAPKGTVGTTQFWRQDWTLATPSGGNVSNSGTPTVDQLGVWVTATTIKGVTALPAANFPALTGDVTTTAASLATTIGANKVTLGMMATMATDSILGRATALTGNVEVLSSLPFAYTGDVTRAADSNTTVLAAGNAGNLNSGTLLAARMPAFTGDVTSTAGATANTLVNIPATTTIAGVAGTRGDVLYYGASGWAKLAAGTSGNQLTTNGAGADPTWAAPGSGGGGTPGGSNTQVQWNNASAFGGISSWTTDGTVMTLTGTSKFKIIGASGGTGVEVGSLADTFSNDLNIRNASANNRTTLMVMPRGTVANIPATFQFYGTDAIADAANYERLVIYAKGTSNNTYQIQTQALGTGSRQPISISADNTETELRLNTDGSVTVGTAGTPIGNGNLAVQNVLMFGGGIDTGLYRNAPGVVEVNNGTPGTYRDLRLRSLFLTNGSTTDVLQSSTTGLVTLANTGGLLFSSTGASSGTVDTALGRNSAGVIEITNGTSATYRDIKLRTLNATSGYQINGTAVAADYINSSVSSQSPSTSDVYVTGSNVVVPAGAFAAKGQYRCLFDVTKTAGTGGIVISVRTGTAGTTADTANLTFTFAAGTSVADVGVFEVFVNWRTVGSGTSAVVSGVCRAVKNTITAAGLWGDTSAAKTIVATVSGGFASNTFTNMGVSFNGGTAFAGTVTTVQASLNQ